MGDIIRVSEGSLAPLACLEDTENGCGRQSCCQARQFWAGLDPGNPRLRGFGDPGRRHGLPPGGDARRRNKARTSSVHRPGEASFSRRFLRRRVKSAKSEGKIPAVIEQFPYFRKNIGENGLQNRFTLVK